MRFPIEQEFKLTENFLNKYEHTKPNFGFDGLGEFVFLRTYSRVLPNGKNEAWWETVKRVVEGVYSIQKQHIEDYKLGWNQMKAQKSAQEMYDRIFTFKMLASGRALWAMGTPLVMEKGLTESLFNCFSGDEKFLTITGYKKFSEANKTEKVLTINGQWKESEIKQFGKQQIVELRLKRSGKTKTIRTTENHLWFANQDYNMKRGYEHVVLKTSELQVGMRLKYQFANASSSVRIPSPQGIQHGFVFGDGTRGHLDLQKGKDESLLKYFGENRTFEKDGYFRIADLPEHYKNIPNKEWDKKYMLGFLMGYFAADGNISDGQITISSSKAENLEFFKEMAETCGIGSYDIRLSSIKSNYKEERTLYQMTLLPSTLWREFFILKKHYDNFKETSSINYWRVDNVTFTDEKEMVFCAIVPEKECFVLTDGILTHNCSYLSTKDISENPGQIFAKAMDFLMCGTGVGSDVLGAETIIIKEQKKKENTYVIPDSREGWVESLRLLINSFFGGDRYIFDYSLIRPAGSPIKTFGGTASGYGPLKDLHEKIQEIYSKETGKLISARVIADTMNLIGKTVIAGNVRRSAEIIFGESTEEFLDLKDYEKNPERSEYGWASNNSVYAKIGMDYSEIAKRIAKQAEPGLYFIENAKKYGRIRDDESNYKDSRVSGANPCFSYDSMLLTEKGYIQIGSLDGKEVRIVDSRGITQNGKVFMSGTKRTITLTLSNGKSITCTPNHVFANENLSEGVQAIHSLGFTLKSYQGESPRVVSIAEGKYEPVYDFSLPEHHWGVVNGFVVHNCLEMTLEDGELCTLAEIIPTNHESLEDFKTTIKYAYLFAKTITLTGTNWNDSNRVMLRNRRVGLSLTGLAQFEATRGINELKKWMEVGYETAKKYDVIYSDWFSIPQSIKMTTVKPSGTLSLLAGVTPGIHYPQSKYYIRRIRLSNTSPYIAILKSSGYKIEPAVGQEESTSVVEFPVSLGDKIRTLNEVSMWEQLNFAAFAQRYWSDNAVSVTVTFKKNEEKDLESALNLFQFQLKGVSFLPQLDEGAYPQMPYEEISKGEYEKIKSSLQELDFSEMFSVESSGEKYCNNEGCAI